MKKLFLVVLLLNVNALYSLDLRWPTPQYERKKGSVNLNVSFIGRVLDGSHAKDNNDYCDELENILWGTSTSFYSRYKFLHWALGASLELDYYLSSKTSLRFGIKYENRKIKHTWENAAGYDANLSSESVYFVGSLDIMRHLPIWIYGFGLSLGVPLNDKEPYFSSTHPSNPDNTGNYKMDLFSNFGLRFHIGLRTPILYRFQRTSYAKVFWEWLVTLEVNLTKSVDYKNFIVDPDIGLGMGAAIKIGLSFVLD